MTFRIARQCAIVGALLLLLAACTTAPISEASVERPTSPSLAYKVQDAIELAGRLSVRYESNYKDEALHGSFTWSQTPDHTIVTLLSPLGQTMALIEVTPGGATLKQSGQVPRIATDVDTLTAETLGWPLPVSGLREWLQGFAINEHGQRFIATPSTTEVITQDGWHLRYANWQTEVAPSAPVRPKRIDLTRATAQAGDVSIRIVIDSWQPH